ncbi:hypothetical protein DACRYDRAFT_55663 [Dacryopinax primogenitus]|uniref:Glycosyltransferase 61 catalytic domain-containing protein n=1 Tax=Dacryopinax primogenitus (strain DJM 731) TaxID=1858805 RepID=M5FV52_DACPD|nr:uncharacterized protein DACRYDRAFT_55663 [Dacryopinax primogenitus]EJT99474.1 hypothetical protein DACRYDRAFT_55663 [Dacryopinax primogenitus]
MTTVEFSGIVDLPPPAQPEAPSIPISEPIITGNHRFFPPPPPRTIVKSSLPQFSSGWTVFQNLYFSNGTFFIVKDQDQGGFGEGYWPERRLITSTGLPGLAGNEAEREPGLKEMEVIDIEEAKRIWEDRVFDVGGFSVLVNDPTQFLRHYYHVAAELFFATERVITNFDPMPAPDGTINAPNPNRMIFIHCDEEGFSDGPGLDHFFLAAQFPSMTPLFQPSWERMAQQVEASRRVFRFPGALFVDRSAAFRGGPTGSTSRTPASPWQAGGGSFGTGGLGRNQFWYESARRRVLSFAGVSKDILDIGLRAMDPPLATGKPDRPVITYISRQRTSRKLREEDHESLVDALQEMCLRHNWEFQLMVGETMPRDEQLLWAARTTVMVGVHGNGLTHQLMMPPHPRSAILEMYRPPNFAKDYEWTAGVLGHAYYTIHNDTFWTPPKLADINYDDWNTDKVKSIPVYAPNVVEIIEQQLLGENQGPKHWQSWREDVGY